MEIIKNQEGQTGTLIAIVGSIFLFGLAYIMMGVFFGSMVTVTNNLISTHAVPFSQSHKWSMDSIFRMYWLYVIIFIILVILYTIKKGNERSQNDLIY